MSVELSADILRCIRQRGIGRETSPCDSLVGVQALGLGLGLRITGVTGVGFRHGFRVEGLRF